MRTRARWAEETASCRATLAHGRGRQCGAITAAVTATVVVVTAGVTATTAVIDEARAITHATAGTQITGLTRAMVPTVRTAEAGVVVMPVKIAVTVVRGHVTAVSGVKCAPIATIIAAAGATTTTVTATVDVTEATAGAGSADRTGAEVMTRAMARSVGYSAAWVGRGCCACAHECLPCAHRLLLPLRSAACTWPDRCGDEDRGGA